MRELDYQETDRLAECLKELAEHHNEVSNGFKGCYPKRPFAETLEAFREDIQSGKSRIAVVEENDRVLGFCKTDVCGTEGKIDYLIVLKEARGSGYGNDLMDWAVDTLKQSGVNRIEVRVVDGNNAVRFYEKYGFRINAQILRMDV